MSILAKGLCKRYGDKNILDNYTIEITEPTLLNGTSGVGKTTLLRLLLGLERPDSGSVTLQGRPGVVFQEDRLIPQLTAEENIRLAAGRALPAQTLREAFAALGLEGQTLTTPCAKLSGGQKRRVALLRALLCGADCLLLDEPFTGLDEAALDRALEFTKQAVGSRPCLLICHDTAAHRLGWRETALVANS